MGTKMTGSEFVAMMSHDEVWGLHDDTTITVNGREIEYGPHCDIPLDAQVVVDGAIFYRPAGEGDHCQSIETYLELLATRARAAALAKT